MTKDEALRLALSTLNEVRDETFRLLRNGERLYSETKVWDTIYEIKKALETKDEPVAWEQFHEHMAGPNYNEKGELDTRLRVDPVTGDVGIGTPQRTWVGLTELDCVGWFGYDTGVGAWFETNKGDDDSIPLYKEPPQREWVGLTDEEIQECLSGLPTQTIDVYARRIEIKIKEKNNG